MKQLSYLLITLWALLVVSCSDSTDVYVSLGLDDTYVVECMQPLTLTPGYEGDSYQWLLSYEIGGKTAVDSLVATTHSYTFVGEAEGSYRLEFHLNGGLLPTIHTMTIEVRQEQVAYSPYITRVCEYRPAPGQFVNMLPKYAEGDTEETMRQKAEESLVYNGSLISLGGYGGYVVVGFDHTIVNRPGVCDFQVLGNATTSAAEPGIVMVSLDTNNNGEPDDAWYELAGSEYDKPETIKNYEITYICPDEDKEPVPGESSAITDATYIRWEDNQESVGYVMKNTYHKQSYYPLWLDEPTMTFQGTRLPDNGVKKDGIFTLIAYDYGYVDNYPNASEKSHFDIAWAIDNQGNPVQLSGVDFIKIYTAVNQYNGPIGECSTEIMGVTDLYFE